MAACALGGGMLLSACGDGGSNGDPTSPPGPTGTLQVTVATDGRNIDPDGYTLAVGTAAARSIGVNDVVTFTGLQPGVQSMTLTGVSANCYPFPSPLDFVVTANTTREAEVGVECLSMPGDLELTFVRLNLTTFVNDLGGVRTGGTGVEQLTFNPASDRGPDWSPDGTKLAWSREPGVIHIVNADGTGLRTFTDRGQGVNPAWSPDGSRIAYDNGTSILVFDPNGTGETVLATGIQPAWSPDGTKIAFEYTDETTESDIIVMNADGSGAVNITQAPILLDREPSWSPDGTRIVFRRLNRAEQTGYDLWVMDADGGNAVKILELAGPQLLPKWLPGNRILFDHDRGIWAIDLDQGGTLTQLTGETGFIHGDPAIR